MLMFSMSVSADGFIADPRGAFGWTAPNEELCFHPEQVRELCGYLCGRRLQKTTLVWETDRSLRTAAPRPTAAAPACSRATSLRAHRRPRQAARSATSGNRA